MQQWLFQGRLGNIGEQDSLHGSNQDPPAGIDGDYQRGVPVGSIAAVAAGAELFHRIRVVPRVDFGLLDHVFILGREPIPEALKEGLPDASP